MDVFLKRVMPPQESQVVPSGDVPEGTAITGDDSSKRATAREDFPVGRDVQAGDSDVDDPDPVQA